MPRQAKTDLRTKTARLRLPVREQPYFTQAGPNLTLGYRRKGAGPGAWLIREGKAPHYRYATFATADDLGPADGRDVLTFEQAMRQATSPALPTAAPITVRQAVEAYLTVLAGRSDHAKEARQRAEKWILPTLGRYRVDRLTKRQIEEWHAGMVREDADDPEAKRRSQDTANRHLTILRAALNSAFADDANNIPSDSAWRRVKAFRAVAGARSDHFDAAQVRKLIAEAAKFDKPFANLCEAAFLTGARYGELAACNVAHFDEQRAVLAIPDGKTGSRPVTLSAEGVAFFKRMANKRPAAAILLPRADGDRWGKSEQHRPFKRAAAAAGLPASASFYALRHSHISRAIEAGMPLSLVAENCGTSLLMIQRNYAKVLAGIRRDTVNATAPRLRRVK